MNTQKTNTDSFITSTKYEKYQSRRRGHWNDIAIKTDNWRGMGGYYHRRIQQVYRQLIPTGAKVLELGCGRGELLAALEPSVGVGVDFSEQMLDRANLKYPNLHFKNFDVHEFQIQETDFDFIIISDLLNDLWDVHTVLNNLTHYCQNHTKIIINTYSHLWELPLSLAEKLQLANPVLYRNWLTIPDIHNFLDLSGYETIRSWQEILSPLGIPLLAPFLNRVLVRFWPFRELALTNFIIARKKTQQTQTEQQYPVSIVVPARNEAGNIERIFNSIPDFNTEIELLFVEGHSQDDTFKVIQENIKKHPDVSCQLMRQSGIGNGNAVREGFSCANGDILMILDADLTVPWEYLPRFYKAIASRTGEFINGVRLVYPMEKKSMRFANFLGNKFFSLLFSWILGQPIKDTLCGTKVLWKSDYLRIAENRSYFGDFDPFGDFDLLLGAAKLNLKIVDMPIRYEERSYGTTNIQRWRHGWLLLTMAAFAIRKLKFQ